MNEVSNEFEVVFMDLPGAPEAPDVNHIYKGCGETKTCFGIGSSSCVATRQCNTIGSVTYKDSKFTFEMRASGSYDYD